MLIGGALANALAFTGSSYLFHRLSVDGIDTERAHYHEVFGHELPPLPWEPMLSDYYTPTNEQHYRELGFIVLSMIGIGGVLYYLKS